MRSVLFLVFAVVMSSQAYAAKGFYCFPANPVMAGEDVSARLDVTYPNMGVGQTTAKIWPTKQKLSHVTVDRTDSQKLVYSEGDKFVLEVRPNAIIPTQLEVDATVFSAYLRGEGLTDDKGEQLACWDHN